MSPRHAVGRPRDERIDREVVSAVLHGLRRGGYHTITIEGIARKVGRARTSVYRRWRSKRHLVVYAIVGEMGRYPAPDTGTLRGDLTAAVGTLRRAFAGPLGQGLAGLVAHMAQDAQLAHTIRHQVLAARRQSMRQAFARARARGELRRDVEVEVLLDMLTAPFFYRTLFRHATITADMTRAVVDYVVRIATRGV